MGGGVYHSDVSQARRSIGTTRTSRDIFQHSQARGVKQVHRDLNIKNAIRECCDSDEHPLSTPIVVAMDVTSSRGDDAKAIYSQVPSMLAAIEVNNLVSDPAIMWAAIGDANTDLAPIQVSQWEADRRIDEALSKIWMEEGGGGTGEESYELLAYYLANKTQMDSYDNRGEKGYLFITGDEAPYPTVSSQFIKKYIGDDVGEDLSSKDVFAKLQEKFHTFLIFPKKTMEQRRDSINSEIQKRLEKAGGKFKDVSIRASLIWQDRNDLDLHCTTPDGSHIYYGDKRSRCGGELDVDQNVRGENPKPVENIRWEKGRAQSGKYRFWVENYKYHESDRGGVPFQIELDIDGEIQTFNGVTPKNSFGSESRVDVVEFEYSDNQSTQANTDNFAPYADDVILGKWNQLIPASNVFRIQDPAASVEVMLGILALQSGRMNLSEFKTDMSNRNVSLDRIDEVASSLNAFASQGISVKVDEALFG